MKQFVTSIICPLRDHLIQLPHFVFLFIVACITYTELHKRCVYSLPLCAWQSVCAWQNGSGDGHLAVWKAGRGPGASNDLLPIMLWQRKVVPQPGIRIIQFSLGTTESWGQGVYQVESSITQILSFPLCTACFFKSTLSKQTEKAKNKAKKKSLEVNHKHLEYKLSFS